MWDLDLADKKFIESNINWLRIQENESKETGWGTGLVGVGLYKCNSKPGHQNLSFSLLTSSHIYSGNTGQIIKSIIKVFLLLLLKKYLFIVRGEAVKMLLESWLLQTRNIGSFWRR